MAGKVDKLLKTKANRFFLGGILLLLVVAVIGGISGAAVSYSVKKASQDKRKECVLRIGDQEVSREQFEMFCVTVIEGSSFVTLEAGTASENALVNVVKARAAEYAQQYFALKNEAEQVGLTLSPLEKAEVDNRVNDIPKNVSADDYYVKNYGVTREGYRDFLCGWKLCEKYVNYVAENSNPDEALEREIFEQNAEKLGWARADVIYFSVSTSDAGGAELKKSLAEEIAKSVNAVPDNDKERIFKSYFDNYNEDGFASSGINVELRGGIAGSYPVLFEAVKKAEENHCYVVDDGIAVFAVRVRERFMYDYYRDTPELKQIIFDDLCKRAAQDLIGSGKYEIIQTAAMSTVDVKPLIAARKKLDGR